MHCSAVVAIAQQEKESIAVDAKMLEGHEAMAMGAAGAVAKAVRIKASSPQARCDRSTTVPFWMQLLRSYYKNQSKES